jgi:hypothetical protein
MKRGIASLLFIGLIIAKPVWAFDWMDRVSFRVQTMGSAGLVIEDETTRLNLVNHFNPAGLALEITETRLDLGESGQGQFYSDQYTINSVYTSTDYNYTDLNFQSNTGQSGGALQGFTMQLPYGMVMRVAGNLSTLADSWTSETSTSGSIVRDSKLNESYSTDLGNVELQLAYKLPIGLAFGGQLKYEWATLAYGDLTGEYNFIGNQYGNGSQTDSYKANAYDIAWSLGAGQDLALSESNHLEFGAYLARDSDAPILNSMNSTSGSLYNSSYTQDFNTTIEISGERDWSGMALTEDIWRKYQYTSTPILLGAEAIFRLGTLMESGIYLDYKTRSVQYQLEQKSNGVSLYTYNYNADQFSQIDIVPMARFFIPIGKVTLIPAVRLAVLGSAEDKGYGWNGVANSTYLYRKQKDSGELVSVGVGMQAWEKRVQAGVQCDVGAQTDDFTNYYPNGTSYNPTHHDTSTTVVREGAEFWASKKNALRVGTSQTVFTDKYTGNEYQRKDDAYFVGMGFDFNERVNFDLVTLYELYTESNSAVTSNPGTTVNGGFSAKLGMKIVL